MTKQERDDVITECENVARDIINQCREDGESDLRAVRSGIEYAFADMRKKD